MVEGVGLEYRSVRVPGTVGSNPTVPAVEGEREALVHGSRGQGEGGGQGSGHLAGGGGGSAAGTGGGGGAAATPGGGGRWPQAQAEAGGGLALVVN